MERNVSLFTSKIRVAPHYHDNAPGYYFTNIGCLKISKISRDRKGMKTCIATGCESVRSRAKKERFA